MKKLIELLKEKFPNVKFVPSTEPQLEDDEIYLNKNLSLQIVNSNEFGITRTNPFSLEYVSKSELLKKLL